MIKEEYKAKPVVLVVDDNEESRKLVIDAISNFDIDVVEAASLADASNQLTSLVEAIEMGVVSSVLVFLDRILPSGKEGADNDTASWAKYVKSHENITVVGMSSALSNGAGDFARAVGPDNLIEKTNVVPEARSRVVTELNKTQDLAS